MLSFRNLLVAGSLLGAFACGTALFIETRDAQACLHPEREFKFPIKAGAQKGLIFFADGREELVIRPSYKVEGEGLKVKNDAVEGFTTLAWLVPVPSLPDVYKEADAKLFSELEDFTKPEERVTRDGRRSLGKNGSDEEDSANGVEFLEEVKVGDYTIQPVKAKGEVGALELNNWLSTNGFGSVEDAVMKYYIDTNHYWLAIKLKNDKGLPANGEVKPLRIGFDTDKPVYPIKINQGRGSFDLELWVITAREIDTEKSMALGFKTVEQQDALATQTNRKTLFSDLPQVVKDVAADDEGLKKLKAGDLYCYRFFGAGVDKDIDLSRLEADLSFSFKAEEKKKD